MSLKAKLVSVISAFVLILTVAIVSVWAVSQANVTMGGTVGFKADNVYAKISAKITGMEQNPTLPTLIFSEGDDASPETDIEQWNNLDLVFNTSATPIEISVTVENLSDERALYSKIDDQIGVVANLTKTVTSSSQDALGRYIEVPISSSISYTITLSPTDPNSSVNGLYEYLITLVDESEVTGIQIQASANQTDLGQVTGGGMYDLGDEITLTATPSGLFNTFLAWATSTDPNTMEILSTSTTYSFELTMDSPKTYYALFNQTTSTSQTIEGLVYTFYNEAKLASVAGASTSLSGAFEIPSVVPSGENSYKVYSIGNNAFKSRSKLTSITIPEGVTSIGDSAFNFCSKLTSITLPSTLTSIGEAAFFYCSGLTSITIPEGVTSIGWNAFNNCSGLTSITIPEGVTTIKNGAFSDCSSLTSISLPSTLTSIGEAAFRSCRSLEAFYGTGNSYYTIDDNMALITDGGKTLLAYAAANPATSYSIPKGATSIGEAAFRGCSSLTEITIPEGVTSIGTQAFSGCSSLTSITIPEGVTSIGNSAFGGCSSLTSIIIPEGVTSIGQSAFSSCSRLASVTILEGVTSIKNYAFKDCSSLTSITLPSTLTSIGSYAFEECSRLASVTIPERVTSIGQYAFYNCSGLTSITLPSTLTSIGQYAFYNCSGLITSITIPEGVTSISHFAFSGCSSITSISLPSTLTSIGYQAFYNCSGITSITIPEGVTSIGDYAFQRCSGLTSITLPSRLTSIGNNTFSYCGSLEAFFGNGNSYYTINDNRALIVDGGKTLLAYAAANPATSYSIPKGVTSIGYRAFYDCSSLTSIIIPEGVTSIGQSAFDSCSGLTEITINGNIRTLDSYAFRNCTNLTKLTLGAGVTSIPSNLFTSGRLTNLTEIVVEAGSTLSAALPTYGTWLKDGGSDTQTNFSGAGTYTRTDVQ